jgi:hypothetical protein
MEAIVHPEELKSEAAYNRAMATRVRLLAYNLPLESDKIRIKRYANELEHHAAELDSQARALRPISSSAPMLIRGNGSGPAKAKEAARRERKP